MTEIEIGILSRQHPDQCVTSRQLLEAKSKSDSTLTTLRYDPSSGNSPVGFHWVRNFFTGDGTGVGAAVCDAARVSCDDRPAVIGHTGDEPSYADKASIRSRLAFRLRPHPARQSTEAPNSVPPQT
jgi:hypothetical protein